jgi:hypothetical protein
VVFLDLPFCLIDQLGDFDCTGANSRAIKEAIASLYRVKGMPFGAGLQSRIKTGPSCTNNHGIKFIYHTGSRLMIGTFAQPLQRAKRGIDLTQKRMSPACLEEYKTYHNRMPLPI